MQYSINVQVAMHGDLIPLASVADVMARHAASGYGKLPFHRRTFHQLITSGSESLLNAARQGRLIVADAAGCIRPCNEILEDAVLPPPQEGGSLAARQIICLFVKAAHLTKWAESNGDEFQIVEIESEVIEFDLKNSNGEIIEKGFYRGVIGNGSERAQTEPSRDAAPAQGLQSRTHTLGTRQPSIMTAEINAARRMASEPNNVESVWGELTKLAEQKYGVMIGFSSDGIQYRGKIYQRDGEPDVFKIRSLRERMSRM